MRFNPVTAICVGLPTVFGVAFMLATWQIVFPPRGDDGEPVGPVYRSFADSLSVEPGRARAHGWSRG